MGRYCFCFFIWVFSFGAFNAYCQVREVPVVVIDPGHGGTDSGAVGMNGIREKDVVFGIAMEALRLNREIFGDSLEIYSTRYNDTLVSLSDRTGLVKALKADVFVSLHCNRSGQKEVRGIEVYIKQDNGQAARLAELFSVGLDKNFGFKNRGVKHGNFQVLRETGHVAGVLLELGFLSNMEEAGHIAKQTSVSAFALLILETLLKYLDHD